MSALRAHGTTAIVAATAALMIAQQVAASAVRDAFFLANYPVSALSAAVIVSSALSCAFLPLLARMMARFGPALVIPLIATVSALLLVAEWLISHQRPELAAAALFVHTMMFGSVLVSGFWSLFSESFDPHTAKQLVGRVAGAAALGGIVGGLLVERAGSAGIDLPDLLPVLAAVQLLAGVGSRLLKRGPARAVHVASPDSAQPFSHFKSSPYLREIALLVGLTAFVSTLTSFLLKAEAAGTYAQSGELLRFFARYYLVLGLVGFVLQINLAGVVLNRFGLGITIAILPSFLGALGLVAFAAPTLWSMALLRGVDEVLSNSLFRSGYELLYTPMAAGTKRRFKAIVDIGVDRLGKSLGSGLVLLVLWLVSDAHARVLLAAAVMGAIATILVAVRLSRGYVASLTRSLKSQAAVSLDANVLDEAITLRTIAVAGIDRSRLLAALADRSAGSGEIAPIEFTKGEADMWGTQTVVLSGRRDRVAASSGAPDTNVGVADPLLAEITDLRSGDPQRIRAILQRETFDRQLVGHMVPLLARDDLVNEAVGALRSVADRATGQLVDILLDSSTAAIVRRRLPRVLAGSGSRFAMLGLLQALDDSEIEVRFRSAGALMRTRETHPDVVVPREAVFEAAVREIRRRRPSLEKHRAERIDPKALELVFRILSLALDAEPLRLAHHALQGDEPHLRGTALEYLETVPTAPGPSGAQTLRRPEPASGAPSTIRKGTRVGTAGLERRPLDRCREPEAQAATGSRRTCRGRQGDHRRSPKAIVGLDPSLRLGRSGQRRRELRALGPPCVDGVQCTMRERTTMPVVTCGPVVLVVVAALAGASDAAWAIPVQTPQSNADRTGRIVATVTALQGTINLSGVDVELRLTSDPTVLARTTTDGAGRVTFPDVPPGLYVLAATRPGLVSRDSAPFQVRAGEIEKVLVDVELTFTLPAIEVRAENASPTDSVQPVATSDLLDGSLLEVAPLEGDDFQSLLQILPGVVRGLDGRLRIKGGQPTQGALQVSSASLVDPSSGDFDLDLPGQSVESVEVLANPFAAEYGRFSSSITQIRTSRGTNEWIAKPGNLMPRFRKSFRGVRAFEPRFSLRGPLKRDRVFLAQDVQSRYVATPVKSLPAEPEVRLKSLDSFTRLDGVISARHTIVGGLIAFPREIAHVTMNTFRPPEVTPDFSQSGWSTGAVDRLVLSRDVVLETTLSGRWFEVNVNTDGRSPMVYAPQTESGSFFNDQEREVRSLQLVEALSVSREWHGQHVFKVGTDLQWSEFGGFSASRPVEIRRVDGSLAERTVFGDRSRQDVAGTEFSVFAQDRWRVGSRLTFEFGLRGDRDAIVQRVNWSPRIGGAISVASEGRAILRGGIGKFVQRTPFNIGAFSSFEPRIVSRFAGDGSPIGSSVTFANVTDSDLHTPEAIVGNVEWDQRFGRRVIAKLAFLGRGARTSTSSRPIRNGRRFVS